MTVRKLEYYSDHELTKDAPVRASYGAYFVSYLGKLYSKRVFCNMFLLIPAGLPSQVNLPLGLGSQAMETGRQARGTLEVGF